MFAVLASPAHRRRTRPLWAVWLALATGCGAATSESEGSTAGSDGESSTTGVNEPGTGAVDEPPPTACASATTVLGSPRTIGEVIAFINTLPRPVTLDCFLERLERPLAITSTSSIISVQPAVGEHSPRVFLFVGDALVLSITVGDYHGFDLLEFGEVIAPARTIKGEIAFPVEAPLAASAPFRRVLDSGGAATTCALCHRDEAAVPDYPLAFASTMLRFREEEAVTLAALRDEHERCDPLVQPLRCARLTALLGHGPVEAAAFSADLPTIYEE